MSLYAAKSLLSRLVPNALRGADIPHNKVTAEMETVFMPLPSVVLLPMQQHVGAQCQPTVKKGEQVHVGTLVGHAEARTSADIFSPASGVVSEIRTVFYANGKADKVVVIEPDGNQTVDESVEIPVITDYESLINAVKKSGIVGLGGAGYPTELKLAEDVSKIDTWLVNAAECEPYISSDYREMMENADTIIEALQLCLDLSGIPRALICIEEDKKLAIKHMRKMTEGDKRIKVRVLPERYPQGAGHVLVHTATGRTVPRGGHVSDVGVVLFNVTTMSMIGKFLRDGHPLAHRRITVMGDAVSKPSNVEVFIGTPISEVLEFCGLAEDPCRVIVGGPMMGSTQIDLDYPIVRQNNGLLAFREESSRPPESSACIRCGKCISACPMGLQPVEIKAAYDAWDFEKLDRLCADLCIKCGTCSYVCPAKRPLTQSTKLARDYLKTEKRKKTRSA